MSAAQLRASFRALFQQSPTLAMAYRPEDLRLAAQTVLEGTQRQEFLRALESPSMAEALQRARSLASKDVFTAAAPGGTSVASAATQSPSSTIKVTTPALPRAPANGKSVAVSGGSSGGMLAALMLARAGYDVSLVEQRSPPFTRDIHFNSRQQVLDQLAAVAPELVPRFLEKAGEIQTAKAFTFFDQVTGETKVEDAPGAQPADPSRLSVDADDVLASYSVFQLECKALETLLLEAVEEEPRIAYFTRSKLSLSDAPDENGLYSVEIVEAKPAPGQAPEVRKARFVPDYVYVVEGMGSATRAQLGIDHAPTTPAHHYLAGTVSEGIGGVATTVYDEVVDPDTGVTHPVHATAVGGEKLENTWVLAEVPSFIDFDPLSEHPALFYLDDDEADLRSIADDLKAFPEGSDGRRRIVERLVDLSTPHAPGSDEFKAAADALLAVRPGSPEFNEALRGIARDILALDPTSEEYAALKSKMMQKYFSDLASVATGVPSQTLDDRPIGGPIAGQQGPVMFRLQGNAARAATFGKQFLFGGDAVHNAHPKASAGMVLAVSVYLEALKSFIVSQELGVPVEEALQAYDDTAFEIGLTWGKQTIGDFYGRNVDPEELTVVWEKSLRSWRAEPDGTGPAPLERLELGLGADTPPQAASA